MTDPNQSLPIAGWYPDPENDKGDRWWNGSSWSDHRRSREAAPAIATPPGYQRPNPYGAPVAPAPVVGTAPASTPLVGAPYQAAQPYASQYPAAPVQSYGQPYAQPYAPGYVQPYTPYAAPSSGMRNAPALIGFIVSTAGLVIGLAFIAGFAGGIVSIVGLQKSRLLAAQGVTTGNGRGFAIAGIIIGFVSAVGSILFFTLIMVSANQY